MILLIKGLIAGTVGMGGKGGGINPGRPIPARSGRPGGLNPARGGVGKPGNIDNISYLCVSVKVCASIV